MAPKKKTVKKPAKKPAKKAAKKPAKSAAKKTKPAKAAAKKAAKPAKKAAKPAKKAAKPAKKAAKKPAKKAAKKPAKVAAKKPAKKKVSAVPKGYHSAIAVMNQADAKGVIAFCTKALDAKLRMSMPGPGGKIMHAELQMGDSVVMVSDAVMEPASASRVFLYVPNVDATMAKAAAAGATVLMPATNHFWGDRAGRIRDPFGNHWMIATHVEDVSPKEMERRAAAEATRVAPPPVAAPAPAAAPKPVPAPAPALAVKPAPVPAPAPKAVPAPAPIPAPKPVAAPAPARPFDDDEEDTEEPTGVWDEDASESWADEPGEKDSEDSEDDDRDDDSWPFS